MKSLFDKTNIKNVELKNRFIRSAVWEGIADSEGHIYNNYLELYDKISRGGIGLIILGYSTIFSYDKPSNNISGIYDDSFIEGYKKVIDVIHKNGSKAVCQIVLGKEYVNKKDKFSSYDFTDDYKREYIEDIIDSFTMAALRVKKAGFDGVQLHCAHGYFLSRTLSPLYNKRTDEYGEKRYRLITEVYESVRKVVGDDYVIGMKINCCDKEEQGAKFQDCYDTCIAVDKLGIDFIEISGGNFYESKFRGKESVYKEEAIKIAENVKCSVALVALNRTIENMNNILNSSYIEYMSLARPIICENDLIKKYENDNSYKPRCVSCGKCYVDEKGNKCILNKRA